LVTPSPFSFFKTQSSHLKQIIWFGANDANRNPSDGQFVPPAQFKANLHAILTHPAITAHSPNLNIILLTPPPFEETMLVTTMKEWGNFGQSRKAGDAREYAQIIKEVGAETGLAVLDVWGVFIERAGWKGGEGEVLPGSFEGGKSVVLGELLDDGKLPLSQLRNMDWGADDGKTQDYILLRKDTSLCLSS
jgi:lysophospholipase L1-like esterase